MLSILFMRFSQEDQCNPFKDAVCSCVHVNDCGSIGRKENVLVFFVLLEWPYIAVSTVTGI